MHMKSELDVHQSLSPFYDRIPYRNNLQERGFISSQSGELTVHPGRGRRAAGAGCGCRTVK